MRKNQIMMGLIFLALLVSLVALAFAEENETGNAYGKKNMTYGKCVAAAAKVKQGCYNSTKMTYSSCKGNVAGDAAAQGKENKGKLKQASDSCKNNYKTGRNQCKAAFKATKQGQCAQIKHNFLETVGAAFY